jgi:hypothetical protein
MTTVAIPLQTSRNRPSLKFEHFGVVLHFVAERQTKPQGTGLTEQPRKHRRTPFRSCEHDLLSYRYVPGRRTDDQGDLFGSEIVGDSETVTLRIPARIAYEYEGTKKHLELPGKLVDGYRERKLAVRASRTNFWQSNYSVFHLAFVSAGPGSFLDEYDLVALSKLWQGGETSRRWPEERIHIDGKTVGDFVRHVFPELDGRPEACRVRIGTVELLTDDQDWTEIWKSVTALMEDEVDDTRVAEERIAGRRLTKTQRKVNALGGIFQGILDFQAIDATELTDVFAALDVDSGAGAVGIHKGTLLRVVKSDRAYTASQATIGVSPYLLLPQAVLLHNEALLDEVASGAVPEGEKNPNKLEDCVNAMHAGLEKYVPNVFHYPQERRLFAQGERSRGLRIRRMQLQEQARNIDTRWQQTVAKRSSFADDLRTALLVLLALLPVHALLEHHFTTELILFGVLAVVAAGTVALPRRSTIRKFVGGLPSRATSSPRAT